MASVEGDSRARFRESHVWRSLTLSSRDQGTRAAVWNKRSGKTLSHALVTAAMVYGGVYGSMAGMWLARTEAPRRRAARRRAARRRLLGMLAVASAASIWGGVYVVSKFVLAYVPPLTLVTWRLAIAGVIFGGALALTGRLRLPRRDLPLVALCGGVGFAVSLPAQFAGTHLSTAHDGAVITAATPAFTALCARLILRERVSGRRWLAVAAASAGIAIVASAGSSGDPGAGSNVLAGRALLVAAALTWALYSVLAKVAMRRHPALVVTAYATFAGLAITAPVGLLGAAPDAPGGSWTQLPALAWWGVLYIGIVSTAIAFYLWNKGFELLEASVASLFMFAQPVVGSVLGALLLSEHLSLAFLAGAVVIVLAIILASWPEPPAVASAPPAART